MFSALTPAKRKEPTVLSAWADLRKPRAKQWALTGTTRLKLIKDFLLIPAFVRLTRIISAFSTRLLPAPTYALRNIKSKTC